MKIHPCRLIAATLVFGAIAVHAQTAFPPLAAVDSIDLQRYAGSWYQTALFPNFFQRQCASDTTATYRALSDGQLEVLNRCRTAQGAVEQVLGVARLDGALAGTELTPARLEVTFLPRWLRWTGIGWARYWVVQLAPDYRYAVVSEPRREYLWVLSRTPTLAPADEATIRARLIEQGFDLTRLQGHTHPSPQPTAR
jgi:apolipoprotein D and lipocalin family protein